MKKKFCDKCGCEIVGYTSPFYLEFKIKKINRHVSFPGEENKIHLCGKCCDKLDAWLQEDTVLTEGPD